MFELADAHIRKICAALNISTDDITGCRRNEAGLNNDTWIISAPQGHWLYRVPGLGTELFCDRAAEAALYPLIQPFGISDELVFIEADTGLKLSVYYPDSHTADIDNTDDLQQAMAILRQLHALPVRVPRYDDYPARITRYRAIAERVNAAFDPVYTGLAARTLHLFETDPDATPPVLSHCDFLPPNILFRTGHRMPIVLDWEFACMGPALDDIGSFCHHADLPQETVDQVASFYFERQPDDTERRAVYRSCAAAAIMWYSWGIFKIATGSEFTVYNDYAQQSLAYCARFLSLAEG